MVVLVLVWDRPVLVLVAAAMYGEFKNSFVDNFNN